MAKLKGDKTRIANAVLYVLKRAHDRNVSDLSKFQLMKLLYLIDIEYRRYLGKSFYEAATFTRWDRGPILFEAYPVLDLLKSRGKIKVETSKNPHYGHDRECHSIVNPKMRINLTGPEKIFLNSIIDSYVTLTQDRLRKIAYATEPMQKAVEKEKSGKPIKERLDMNTVTQIGLV